MSDIGTIELTNAERVLLDQIDFSGQTNDRDRVLRSCTASAQLMRRLIERKAIPERRSRIFLEPEWGYRGESWRDLFVERGDPGDDIFEHPSFLQYLRFLIHGSDLPDTVIEAMREQVGDPKYFSLGDTLQTGKLARKLARNHGLDKRHADAFMHLCADLGLTYDCADAVRRAVMEVRH
ncbi:hypothetical protein QTH90_23875 [Variovorax sp. J2P1-59]|uniref:hypothetical protein n=1 Tax=Variovorax flavidus TaxID=3053501 RepID=UPI002576A5EB|nr:hypothetical protein [Variovorax sp. J2P1-59]MDM0077466.1 hypothetical protein [Variovorax sp. J2P1-59]